MFINDVYVNFNSAVLIYADDLKLLFQINSINDCLQLQKDLDTLFTWCNNNRLSLNIDKCQVLSYSLKTHPILYDYSINNIRLSRPDSSRDLRITFDSKVTFTKHYETVVAESTRTFGFIARLSREFNNVETLKSLFFSLIRSKLEYVSVVWSPEYNQHVIDLERVQRRFLKLLYLKTHGFYPRQGYPEEDFLKMFNMQSLSTRKKYFSQVFLHKLLTINLTALICCTKLNLQYHVRRPVKF